jgi:hypothetical protein
VNAVTLAPQSPPSTAVVDAGAAPPPAEACRNCGAPLGTPRPHYCGECGQETTLKPPTVMEFIQQFGGNYVAMEGALWRTLLLLLFRPGRLTREYLQGRKRRYVLPLRLYLTISVVAMLALRWSTAMLGPIPADHIVKIDKTDVSEGALLEVGDWVAGMKGGQFVCKGLPASWCEHLRERFTMEPESMKREIQRVPERFMSHWGTAMFALLPLYAFYLKLVYLNRRMRWSEHLVFALHLHAFWFLMLGIQAFGSKGLTDLALIAVPVYSVMALQVVYGGRWWATALRVLSLSLVYGLTLVTAMSIVGVWSFIA